MSSYVSKVNIRIKNKLGYVKNGNCQMRKNVPGSSRINMIKGLAYSPSAPCEWGINIWQRTCTASLAFQPPRLLCDRAANYGSIIIGVPDDGTIQFSRCARSDALPCGECRLGNCPFTYEPSRRGKLLPEKENSSKVLQKHSHSLDSLMNRNPFGFQGTCNLGLGVPGIDIERKDFEIKFR